MNSNLAWTTCTSSTKSTFNVVIRSILRKKRVESHPSMRNGTVFLQNLKALLMKVTTKMWPRALMLPLGENSTKKHTILMMLRMMKLSAKNCRKVSHLDRRCARPPIQMMMFTRQLTVLACRNKALLQLCGLITLSFRIWCRLNPLRQNPRQVSKCRHLWRIMTKRRKKKTTWSLCRRINSTQSLSKNGASMMKTKLPKTKPKSKTTVYRRQKLYLWLTLS